MPVLSVILHFTSNTGGTRYNLGVAAPGIVESHSGQSLAEIFIPTGKEYILHKG